MTLAATGHLIPRAYENERHRNAPFTARRPSDDRFDSLAPLLFRRREHHRLCFHRRLVCRIAQACVESAGVGIRPYVESTLCLNGRCCLLVWRKGGWKAQGRTLGLFLLQWLLNALWTPLFFVLQHPGIAFAEIVLLWLFLAATLVSFWRVRQVAGILLVPYLAWVSFAAALNFTIWRMNL